LTILLVRTQHQQLRFQQGAQESTAISFEQARRLFPDAASLDQQAMAHGGRCVLGSDGQTLGYVLQTSPVADDIIGFSGPTNTLIAFGPDDRVVGIDILSSGDTRDHVRQVRQDADFLRAFDGLTWDQAAGPANVDAVTGATLTSLAIQESIIRRLGGGMPSLRFPQPPTLADTRTLLPEAAEIEQDRQQACVWRVSDAEGGRLGTILRTSPAADNIIGYQGPTEALIAFGLDDQVIGVSVRESYDNEPYVSYVRDDRYFLKLFQGMQRRQLAELDLVEAEIEGVSGATMTSMAVAEALVRATAEYQQSAGRQDQSTRSRPPVGLRDAGTMLVVLAAVVIGLTSFRARRLVRTGLLWLLIVYLGLVNGDMLSQAMLVGWSQHGVPWRTSAGLVLLTAAALLLTVTTRRNLYCSHMCPHGAAQQLLKNRLPWRVRVPRPLLRGLVLIPPLLLAWCVVVAMTGLPFSLVDIEPFDAWVFRVAGWPTIAIAVVGLTASLFVPMAYCRFGCPTGALLNYLRFHSRSDRWTRRDWVATGIVALALCLFFV
jgi:transcriptional regulator of nitric oxide reductase